MVIVKAQPTGTNSYNQGTVTNGYSQGTGTISYNQDTVTNGYS